MNGVPLKASAVEETRRVLSKACATEVIGLTQSIDNRLACTTQTELALIVWFNQTATVSAFVAYI